LTTYPFKKKRQELGSTGADKRPTD